MKQMLPIIAILVIVNVPSTILMSYGSWAYKPMCELSQNLLVENTGIMMDSTDLNKSRQVYKTEFKAEADKVVYITPFIAEAELKIYETTVRAETVQSKGIWFWTKIKREANWKIYITKYKNEADIIVYFTKTKPF